jgi:Ca-activated chloride channel family protein
MDLLWPGFLFLLGLIPLIVAAYIWMLRRRQRFVVRYSSLVLVREALHHQSRLRRHLPFALFLLALIGLVIALARPVAVVSVPTSQANIMLAMDVSWSMCSNDIWPNRLAAAQAAAMSFVESQQSSTQIGIVAFAGFAELILAPTTHPEVLEDAIQSLVTGRWTAIGSAILESLDAIAEIDETVTPTATDTSLGIQPTPVPKGAYASSIIVLLTDGASNEGPRPLAAAQQAVDRGVRVYPIGFGTQEGGNIECGPFRDSDLFASGSGRWRRGIDEPTLMQIADMTGGTYYSAESANELRDVFQSLPTSSITKHETQEISVGFVALGALVAGLAISLSLIWHPLS